MPKLFDAVVAGHICLDVIPDLSAGGGETLETMLSPGRLTEVGPVTYTTGGPVSNTGLALVKLGIQTQLMGKIGDDLFGRAIQEIISAYGSRIAQRMAVDKTASSSYTIIISPPGVDRIFLHCPGANDTFDADDAQYDLLQKARLFHFGYPPLMKLMYQDDGAQLVEVFRRAKETGVTTSLDMALPDPSSAAGRANWRKILSATLSYVDIFLPSIEEILYMLRRETYEELSRAAGGNDFLPLVTPELLSDLSRELMGMGVKLAALKLGDQGLYLRTADEMQLKNLGRAAPTNIAAWANKELWTACFEVDVVGATGSGDASIAGFLSALLRDMSPEEALTMAVAVGACNVEAPDALGGIRPWDDTLRRIDEGWQKHALDLASFGWRFDDVHQLWSSD